MNPQQRSGLFGRKSERSGQPSSGPPLNQSRAQTSRSNNAHSVLSYIDDQLLNSVAAVEKATEVRDSARSLKTALRAPGTANFTSAPWTKSQYAAVSSFETESTARYCKALTSESDRSAPRIQRSLQEFGMWATVKALANDRNAVGGDEGIRLSALGGIESLYPLGTAFNPTGTQFETINSVPYKEGWYRTYRDVRPAFLPEEMHPTLESLTAKLVDAPPPQRDNEPAQRTMRAVSSLIQLIELNPDNRISPSSQRDEYDSD